MFCARPWAALLCGLAVGWSLPTTSAAGEPFELSWTAPAECPSSEQVSAALQRLALVGSRVEATRVEIVAVAGRWQATLSTRGAQRRLEGESCRAVVQALTVVLALAAEQAEQESASSARELPRAGSAPEELEIEPSAAQPLAPPPSSAPPAAALRRAPPAADEPMVSPSPARELSWSLRMGVLAETGLLPGPSLGPQAALALHHGPWSLELGAALLLPRRAELGGAGSPSGDIDWLGGQLALCHALAPHLGACTGAELGRLAGSGLGVDEPATAHASWLAASAEARLHGALSSGGLSWQLGLSAAAALLRSEFGFDELGVLHSPSPVSGRLFLGLGWGH